MAHSVGKSYVDTRYSTLHLSVKKFIVLWLLMGTQISFHSMSKSKHRQSNLFGVELLFGAVYGNNDYYIIKRDDLGRRYANFS